MHVSSNSFQLLVWSWFLERYRRYKIAKGNFLSGGVKYTRVGKKRFSTEIDDYFGNRYELGHGRVADGSV